ncbi:MAG TPA: MBL fold metallo-hydrolase [Rubrobacteraceae bacterium]|nr:MBL fold metallo-hydrolase [Rubrobacteraceae bacterium]
MRVEILPGIHRIESDLGVRFMCQYLLTGEDHTVLVDTGLAGTPEEVIIPYLEGVGLSLEDIDEVIISHADVDHCGGNRALKEMHPALWFTCGEPDRAYVENNQVMIAEIYRWSEPYGFGPDEDSLEWIRRELGGDSPVDAGLRGGETMRLGPERRIEILHLPGHTPGHLGIWDPKNGAAIIIDAALETGIYDREGNRLIPPRYFDAAAYQATIRKLQTLRPEHLLTAHYPPMQGDKALDFLDRSLQFTQLLHGVVSEGLQSGTTDLWELTRRAVAQLGPYPEFGHELGAGVRAHLARM